MERSEFAPVWKELCGAFGRDVTDRGMTAMGEEVLKRFKNLSFESFVDLCEAAKDACDKFPSRKELVILAADKKLFECGKPVAVLTPVECTCGFSFIVRGSDLEGFETFDCPGKTYQINGHMACNKSYDAGFLRDAKRASNGVIWISEQPPQEMKYPSFLKD